MVALDGALETFAFADANHIHVLAQRKNIYQHLVAFFELRFAAELVQMAQGR